MCNQMFFLSLHEFIFPVKDSDSDDSYQYSKYITDGATGHGDVNYDLE